MRRKINYEKIFEKILSIVNNKMFYHAFLLKELKKEISNATLFNFLKKLEEEKALESIWIGNIKFYRVINPELGFKIARKLNKHESKNT